MEVASKSSMISMMILSFMPPAGVRFTARGFYAVEIPEDIYKMMTDFWNKWEHTMYTGNFNFASICQRLF